MSSVSFSNPSEVTKFFETYSPTKNGTITFTNTTFSPEFLNCSTGVIERVLNATGALKSCILVDGCQNADTKGCSAVCNLGERSVTIKTGVNAKEDRTYAMVLYNLGTNEEEMNQAFVIPKNGNFVMLSEGKQSFKPTQDAAADKKQWEDAMNDLSTRLKDIKPGATPQEGWSIGTGLAVLGGAAVGGAVVYGAQKMREKEQQNTTDAKSNRVPLTARFNKV